MARGRCTVGGPTARGRRTPGPAWTWCIADVGPLLYVLLPLPPPLPPPEVDGMTPIWLLTFALNLSILALVAAR